MLSVDFHTHILPGIDDGCRSLDDSVQTIRMEQQQGVNRIFLTPHFRAQHSNPDTFIQKRNSAMDILMDALATEPNIPLLIPGAEVSYCPGMSKWEALDSLTIGDTGCLMIEMPAQSWSERVLSELESIYYERGITPIIAHVERCFHPFFLNMTLRKFTSLPVLFQMNCSFLIERKTRRMALKIIKEHNVHLFGSDCHSSTWRAPNIGAARTILSEHFDADTLSFLSGLEEMVTQGSART